MSARAFLVWLLIALAEVIQGYLRVRFLNRRLGDRGARRVGVVTGSLLVFGITWLTLPWIGVAGVAEAWAVGAGWCVLMLAFDVGFGRWVFRTSWARIGAEFDLRRGNLLALGMAAVLAAPWLVGRLRGLY